MCPHVSFAETWDCLVWPYHAQYRAVGFLPPHFAVIQSQLLF
jgi:hypothetical protein